MPYLRMPLPHHQKEREEGVEQPRGALRTPHNPRNK